MPIPYTNTELLQHALIGLEHRREQIDQAIASIRSRLHGAAPARAKARRHHGMSAAAKHRMALLMKHRWQKAKKAGKSSLT